jgi:SAM-dependent methyltransferase
MTFEHPFLHTCRICDTGSHRTFVAREMMFGTRETFEYLECEHCGCVQIATIPPDASRFYPDDYYAHQQEQPQPKTLRDRIRRHRTAYQLGRKNPIGWLLARTQPHTPPHVEWARWAGADLDDAILDVGCGNGKLLLEMHLYGFSQLLGVDPFVEADLDYRNGVRILRRDVSEIQGPFDFVMMHHALEHVPDPLATLREVHRLLRPGGSALIRIPVADSYAWRTYRADWVQLDPPRHFHLLTRRAMEILARSAGLEITEVVHDSESFQFWGSEQYLREIPLRDPRSVAMYMEQPVFSQEELERYAEQARLLNQQGDGDSAGFYLRKPARR